MKKIKFSYVAHGVLRAFILTMISIIIYSLITSFLTPSEKVTSVFIVIITLLSIMYGSIYATLKMKSNGWIIGILVSTFYMIAIFIVSILCGKEFALGTKEILRFIIALIVGTLSGMIAVNL